MLVHVSRRAHYFAEVHANRLVVVFRFAQPEMTVKRNQKRTKHSFYDDFVARLPLFAFFFYTKHIFLNFARIFVDFVQFIAKIGFSVCEHAHKRFALIAVVL